MSKTKLIPMRFIVMIGHLVLLILFLADQVSSSKFEFRRFRPKKLKHSTFKLKLELQESLDLNFAKF